MALKMKARLYLALFTVLLLGIAIGWAGGASRAKRAMFRHGPVESRAVMKTLDDNQRKVFREIRQAQGQEMRSLREKVREASASFDAAVSSGASPETLREKFATIVELRGKLDWAQFEMTLKMRPHLRPEQQGQMRMQMPGHEHRRSRRHE